MLNPPGDFCAATRLRLVTLIEICIGEDEEDSHGTLLGRRLCLSTGKWQPLARGKELGRCLKGSPCWHGVFQLLLWFMLGKVSGKAH